MRYYMIERQPEEEDDPSRLYLEVNDDGVIQRRVETYLSGVHVISKEPETAPADLVELTGDGQRLILSPQQFDDIWYQARELPNGVMGMFF